MAATTAEIKEFTSQEPMAREIAMLWDKMHNERQGFINELEEIHEYTFATDTSTTSNANSGWNNKTTIPKLCQIRDNLHAHYMSAVLPNDDWLRWEGYTQEDEVQDKKETIQAYMQNKVRMSDFRNEISKLLYDYIDGNAFAMVEWANESKKDPISGQTVPGYVGPRLKRISIHDIVFDPTSNSFENSWKIVRSIRRISELEQEAAEDSEKSFWSALLPRIKDKRRMAASFTKNDWSKTKNYMGDGFGSLAQYYGSGVVEVLEFYGSIADSESGTFHDDVVITIVDRTFTARNEPIPTWKRNGYFVHAAWRQRPDNLYGMGPLANLVGMQYRIDHLENLKADIMDLIAAPPLVIKGQVSAFDWEPYAQIEITEDGAVDVLRLPPEALQLDAEISYLLNLMEEFAGAPRQAMGIRTPGEKTAFEVSTLESNSGRIFHSKTTQFETALVEPALNNMLMESAKRMDGAEVIRVIDDDFGVADFQSITKEDITANGKLRPIGARHFAARAQLLQNISQSSSSPIWQKIAPHIGNLKLAKLWEDTLQLGRFDLVSQNAAIADEVETQRMMQTGQDMVAEEGQIDIEGDLDGL